MTDTDIYLGQRRPHIGCLLVVLLVLLVVAGVVYFRWSRPSRQSEPAEPAPAAEEASAPSADAGLQVLAAARQLRAADQLLEARDKALEVLETSSNLTARAGAEALLGEVNIPLVFTPRMTPEKVEYTVASGDSIAVLARKFGTTVEVIRKGNGLSGPTIRVGDRLRIFTGKFSITVDKSANTLLLTMNDRFFKRYAVGTGEYGKTPTGTFSIRDRVPQPTWWKDGKAIPYGDTNNVLGTHWLALDIPGYGIHGTWEPDTIGKQASAGCIRLNNADIEELFMLVPVGVPVTITE